MFHYNDNLKPQVFSPVILHLHQTCLHPLLETQHRSTVYIKENNGSQTQHPQRYPDLATRWEDSGRSWIIECTSYNYIVGKKKIISRYPSKFSAGSLVRRRQIKRKTNRSLLTCIHLDPSERIQPTNTLTLVPWKLYCTVIICIIQVIKLIIICYRSNRKPIQHHNNLSFWAHFKLAKLPNIFISEKFYVIL